MVTYVPVLTPQGNVKGFVLHDDSPRTHHALPLDHRTERVHLENLPHQRTLCRFRLSRKREGRLLVSHVLIGRRLKTYAGDPDQLVARCERAVKEG